MTSLVRVTPTVPQLFASSVASGK